MEVKLESTFQSAGARLSGLVLPDWGRGSNKSVVDSGEFHDPPGRVL